MAKSLRGDELWDGTLLALLVLFSFRRPFEIRAVWRRRTTS